MGIFDGLAGGLAGAAGSLIGGVITNEQNRKEARKNREFQAGMSNTAHQREVKDLEAAGLNPILSATGGSGASTPSGSQATMSNPFEGAVTSAKEMSMLTGALEKQKEETNLLKAQKRNTDMDTISKSKEIPKADILNKAYEVLGKPLMDKAIQGTSSSSKQSSFVPLILGEMVQDRMNQSSSSIKTPINERKRQEKRYENINKKFKGLYR